MDPVLTGLVDYGWAAVLMYVVVKEGAVLLSKVLPAAVKRRAAKDKEEVKLREERRRFDDNLRARQVEATENIAKSLVILQNNQGRQIDLLNQVASGIEKANTGIAVLLDRKMREEKSKVKT